MKKKPASSSDAGALAALDAEDLRALIREVLPELDEDARALILDQLSARAARKGRGWTPEALDEGAVAEIVSFAKSAERNHQADPDTIDRFLRCGMDAFLRRDYAVARRVFEALLPPLADVEIDLGQHESLDEVLSVDTGRCAAQYVVAVYMTTEKERRADAVHAAIRAGGELGLFWEPIQEMEDIAVAPLTDLDDFLPRWRALVEREASDRRGMSGRGSDEDRWLREVVLRLEGTEGLASRARATRRGEDLHAWCEVLVESRDWKAALTAFDEAAALVCDGRHWGAEFQDGAAVAAQELGRADLPDRFERAWRVSPSLVRLRRWLGTQRTAAGVRKLAAGALAACPKRDERQLAFLHLVAGNFESAARLLSESSGLGWSGAEHPGHLLFPLFIGLLGDGTTRGLAMYRSAEISGLDLDELELVMSEPDEPRIASPKAAEILDVAGVRGPIRGGGRSVMLAAVREAAEKRVEGLTREKRRGHYAHAARLIAECAALETKGAGERWVAGLRARYSRFPALQRELEDALANPGHKSGAGGLDSGRA